MQKKVKNSIITYIAIILVGVIVAFGILYMVKNQTISSLEEKEISSPEESKAVIEEKIEEIKKEEQSEEEVFPEELSGQITATIIQDSNLNVYAMINGFLDDEATCTLYIKQEGSEIAHTSSVAGNSAQSSACGVLSIPIEKLNFGEHYSLEIKINTKDQVGIITGEYYYE